MNGAGVLVVLEQRAGTWNRMSFEALAAGQQLAAKLGATCSAAVLGSGQSVSKLSTELATKQLDKVYSVDHALLASYTADGFVAALEQLVQHANPAFVLFPHTYQVRDFAPALATRFRKVLISDVIAIHTSDPAQGPIFVRQLLQGKLNANRLEVADSGDMVRFLGGVTMMLMLNGGVIDPNAPKPKTGAQ